MNQYYADPDLYTSDDLDYAIEQLYLYEKQIKEELGISTENPTEPSTDPSVTPTEPSEQPSTNSGSNNGTTAPPTNPTQGGSSSNGNSGEASNGGTTFERISEEEFLKMTLEEKKSYISTLTPQEQQIFFSMLTPEELKNIVKQFPTDQKAEVVDTFVNAGESLGVNITVNEITDESISMTMKDNEGELLDVAAVGVIVEDTGYDYTTLFAVSGGFVLIAGGALWLVIRKCFGNNNKEAENEN